MSVRGLCFWSSMFAIATACSDDDGGGASRSGDAGQGGADAAGSSALDGGEPADDDGGSQAIGAAGTAHSGGGASGTTASGGAAADTAASGGASEAGTGALPAGNAGESGGSGAATLRVDVTYGGACGSDADRCSSMTFDEGGNLIGAFEDQDCDGVPDAQCSTFVVLEGESRAEHDTDCSGKPEVCSIVLVVTNDARAAAGENCESAAAECTTYLKDATGDDQGYEIDDDCDGAVEHCFYFREEPAGTRHGGYDIGCDGTVDSGCQTITANSNTGYTREELDSDCDGQADNVRCFVDDGGVQRNAGEDRDCDGALDAGCHIWTYDEGGKPISYGNDDDCDGTFDSACSTFSYDAFGHSTQETDANCDGATCTRWVNYGQASGGLMVDVGCDGQLDSNCEIWSLDDEGRPLRFDYDHDCDGTPSLTSDATGPCWTTWRYTPI